MPSGDGAGSRSAVYLAFSNSTCARNAVGVRQLWRSLPSASKLLLILVTAEASLWAVKLASARRAQGCSKDGPGCSLDSWQVTITTAVAQLCNTYLTLDAVGGENPFQLLAATGLSILTGLIWLTYMAVLQRPSAFWQLGVSLAFATITVGSVWLTYLTHQQFGWRVHSKIPCDFRRKHAVEKQHLYHSVLGFRTLLRLSCYAVLINAVNGLVLALGTRQAAQQQAGGTSASVTSNVSVHVRSGLLAAVGLYGLALAWLAVTYLAVRRNSSKVERLSSATMFLLLLLPAFPLYWVFSPQSHGMWQGRMAVRVLLAAVPLAAWLVLHVATWYSMRQVLRRLRSPNILQVVADAVDDTMDLQQDVPEQLQPLLQGAWLVKGQSASSGRMATSASNTALNGSSKHTAKQSDYISAQRSAININNWVVPSATSVTCNCDHTTSSSRLQAYLGTISSTLHRALTFISGSNEHWRFFQLSVDLTTLRWAWNKYVLLYYVDSFTVDASALTISLHMALDPDLTLVFKDPRLFDQWESALQLLLHMLTGAAPGSIPAGMYPATAAAATAVAQTPPHPKKHMSGLLGQASSACGSSQIAGLQTNNGVDWAHTAMVGLTTSGPSPILQHSLVMSALHAQHCVEAACAEQDYSGRKTYSIAGHDDGALSGSTTTKKRKASLNSFLRASRRHSMTDPDALKLRRAQAAVEVVTKQLSSVPYQMRAAGGSGPGPLAGFYSHHHHHQQQYTEPQHTQQYLQQEHRAWLQQGMHSSHTSSLISLPAPGRPFAPEAAAAAPAAVSNMEKAAEALARQLHLSPHQMQTHLHLQQANVPQPQVAGGGQHAGGQQATALQLGGHAPPTIHMGPFRTPQGLIRQMHLNDEQSHRSEGRWQQLSSSSEEGSAAATAAWQGITEAPAATSNGSLNGCTGTSCTSAAQDGQQQESFGSSSESPDGARRLPAAHLEGSTLSRLQQQSPAPPGQDHAPQQQSQQQSASGGQEGSPQVDGVPAHLGVTGRGGFEDSDSSSKAGLDLTPASLMSAIAAPDRLSLIEPTNRAEGRDGQQHSFAQGAMDNRILCQQQQLLANQFFEHQYSQPPAPNIHGVYTSTALGRRGESPQLLPEGAAASSSKLLHANSMPAAMKRYTISKSPEAVYGSLLQQTECGGVLAHPGPPATLGSLFGGHVAAVDNTVNAGSQFMYSAFTRGPLQPLEEHKPAALWLDGCLMPPVPEDLVSGGNSIRAVWGDEEHLAMSDPQLKYAAMTAHLAYGIKQSVDASRFMIQPMQARGFDVQSNRTTAGGSVSRCESQDSRSHCSAELPEAPHHPAARHTHMPDASGNTNSISTAALGHADDRSAHGASVHTPQHHAELDSRDVQSPQQLKHPQLEGLPASLSPSAEMSPCTGCNSTQVTIGSSNTSRPLSPWPAGVPSFSAVMAQVEGSTWAGEVAVVGSGSIPRPCRVNPSGTVDRGLPEQAAPHTAKDPIPSSGRAAAGAEGQHSFALDKPSKSSGGTWLASLRHFMTTVTHTVSGRGAGALHSTEPQEGDKAATVAISLLSHPAATSSRQIPSPSPAAVASINAVVHPMRRLPKRSPSVPTAIRESASFKRTGSFTVTGQRTYMRRGSFADSLGASNTDGLLTRGASRTSIGNVTAYGWSDWGRSTLTDFDSMVELDSSVVLSDDGGPQDLQVAQAGTASVQVEDEPGWAAVGYGVTLDSSQAGFAASQVATAHHRGGPVGSAAHLRVSSCSSSRRSSDSNHRQAGPMQPKQAIAATDLTSEHRGTNAESIGSSHAVAASPDVHLCQQEQITACSDGARLQGQLADAACLSSRHPFSLTQATLVHEQLEQQPNNLEPATSHSAGSTSGVASAAVGQSRTTTEGHLGLGRVPSVLYSNMPLLPVLQEAPSSAELDTPDASGSPAEPQQEVKAQPSPDVISSFSTSREQEQVSGPVAAALMAAPWLPQGLQLGQQLTSPMEQDDSRLHSFTFNASVHREYQQPTLQAAYLLAKSMTVADGVVSELMPSLAAEIGEQQQQQGELRSSRVRHSASFKQTNWLSHDNSSSTWLGAVRPAVLQVDVSDAAEAVSIDHPGAVPAVTVGSNMAAALDCPSKIISAAPDSPQGLGSLQVKVPVCRRSSVPGQSGSVQQHAPSISHQSNLGIAQHYQQHQQQLIAHQLPQHDDGYAVTSPSSLMSCNSHISMFADTSPRAGRTWRQSMVSAGYGASSQLANSLSMTYSGWSTHSGVSNRGNSSSFRRGMTPQVSVELVEWHLLQLGRKIGHGAEGCVYEARYRDAPVAVKEAPDMNEIEMYLAAGVHDNLVGLRGLCQKDDTWCLLLEYCGRGTLDTLLHHSSSPLPRAQHQHLHDQDADTSSSNKPPGTAADHQQQQPGRQDLVKLLPFMRSIARGLLHLHSRRPAVLHRDIKPANIFIGHGMVMKIGDFGMSRLIFPPVPDASGSSHAAEGPPRRRSSVAGVSHIVGIRSSSGGVWSRSAQGAAAAGAQHGTHQSAASHEDRPNRTLTPGVVGTICYSAPEVLDEQLQAPNASVEHVLKADVYSLGVTIWEMVERKRPFNGMDGMQICALWIADPAHMTLPPLTVEEDASDCDRRVLAGLQELVRDCTAFDPDKRPGMSQVLAKIRHIQRMYDPKAVAAEAARVSRALARAEAAVAHNAETAPSKTGSGLLAGPDCTVLPTASLHDGSQGLQQQNKAGAQDAASDHYAPWELQDPYLSMGPSPEPGVTDPAVAAAIAAAAARGTAIGLGTRAYEASRTAGSMSIWRPEGSGAERAPAVEGVNRSRSDRVFRSREDNKGDTKTASGNPQASRGLLHSRSLPNAAWPPLGPEQVIVLPDARDRSLGAQTQRRVSGAGLHHRHS